MSSLRGLIGEAWSEISNGVAWIAIYKDGRSWQAEAFYPESGDYENGYVLSDDDYREIDRISGIDHKAICVNGYYMGFGEDFTLKELENKILYFYEKRLNQLQGDFIGGICVPPDALAQVDSLLAKAQERSEAAGGSTSKMNEEALLF